MSKLILGLIALTLFSCGYNKKNEIRYSKYSHQNEYWVWVYYGLCLKEGFYTPIKGITEKKKDSVNALADNFILDCEMTER